MNSLRILIAEDDSLISELLEELLVGLGHVVCASGPTAAGLIQSARQLRPGLLIVDRHLADGSGFDAVAAILRTGFVPHILVTGDIVGARADLPDAVLLQKPYTMAALTRAIDRACTGIAPIAE